MVGRRLLRFVWNGRVALGRKISDHEKGRGKYSFFLVQKAQFPHPDIDPLISSLLSSHFIFSSSFFLFLCEVHAARGLANRLLVGQMDPYAVVHLSNSKDAKFKTKVVKDAHQNPVWEQSYIFNLEGKEELLHCVRIKQTPDERKSAM